MDERLILLNSNDDKDKDKESDILGRRLLKARIIMISEPITDKLAQQTKTLSLLMQEEDAAAPITVYVNSPGGSADSGFAIYDMLRFVTPPIHMICTGICASAAVLIYMAAEKNKRFSLPNSRFLLHQPSTSLFGTASDIEINANEIIKLRERYNKIIAKETGKSLDKITQDADRDFWLNANEAKEYGLVGSIVESHKDLESS